MPTRRGPRRRGFTLIELMVVVAIIGMITVTILPMVIATWNERQMGDAARLLQATINTQSASAIQSGNPRGLRLLLDPQFDLTTGPPLAVNRMIAIEAAPNYSEGKLSALGNFSYGTGSLLMVNEVAYTTQMVGGKPVDLPEAPTSWYWNIRKGDRIQIGTSGHIYTIVGPMGPSGVPIANNPEQFINEGLPGTANTLGPTNPITSTNAEVLFLVDGRDTVGVDSSGLPMPPNGFVDDGFDGIDNNGNGTIDEAAEQVEIESPVNFFSSNSTYTIYRRPMPVRGVREVALPPEVVIDMTRSQLPFDPVTGYTDILMGADGKVVSSGPFSGVAALPRKPFYHFWLADRDDVVSPLPEIDLTTTPPSVLPSVPRFQNLARLVTLNAKTGLVTSRALVPLPADEANPYINAEWGVREP